MKAKNVDGKIYVSEKPYFGRSETFCIEISVETLFYSSFGFNKDGLKAQQHIAQGKRSDTLGIACWSSRAL